MTAVVLRGDARQLPLPDGCVDLIVTSPPYFGLRSYTDTVKCYECIQMEYNGRDPKQAWPDYARHVREVHVQHYNGQIGTEPTPQEWLAALWECTREWVRVLKPEGSLFVNLGDKYATSPAGNGQPSGKHKGNTGAMAQMAGGSRKTFGVPAKSLLGLPWRYAIGCTDHLGLILRAEIVWSKPNGLPESVTDRVRRSHEQVFHFTRQPRYYAAVDEIREPHIKQNWDNRSSYGPTPSGYINGHRPAKGDAGLPLNPLGKLPGSVWSIPSAPLTVPAHLGIDHFAAFPPALVRPLVLGWSPPGVCTGCGQGRRPVTTAQPATMNGWALNQRNGRMWHGDGADPTRALGVAAADRQRTITGYTCACMTSEAGRTVTGGKALLPASGPPTRPAVVLDPFAGTGTTMLVASAYGRVGIGVDRSMDYARLARWRVNDPGERARARDMPKPPPIPDGMEPLFTM